MLMTRKNLLLFGQRGVINPAKIKSVATGRLANRGNFGSGPGSPSRGMDGFEMKIQACFDIRGKLEHSGDNLTSETIQNQNPGDMTDPAGKFTTKAFQAERRFEVGSAEIPYTATSRRSTHAVAMEPCGYDASGTDGVIPEGRNRDLGGAGEYDPDHSRTWLSFSSVPSPLTSGSLSPVGARLHIDPAIHGDLRYPLNFLDLSRDSKHILRPIQAYLRSYPSKNQHIEPESHRGFASSKAGSSIYARKFVDAGICPNCELGHT
jgi:hypothetical protein